ncbi:MULTISPECIES: terminase large subunit domain-containing protein [unclassified Microbacterium]
MPWQQLVADVAGEIDPKTGLPVYREVVIFVPRQSGKTTLILSEMVHRAWAFGRPQLTRYAAQTGDDAISKWKEHVELLERTQFRKVFRTDDVNGQRALIWSNGSRYTPTATTKRSGHGKTLDQGIIDEAFAQVDFRTEQAMRPAMLTRRDAQLIILSTAGDASSIFLNAKLEANRERLMADPLAPSSTAYFEWSASPEDDPFDEDTWWRCMPALGRTIAPATIRADLDAMLADPREGERGFRRAYLNQTDYGVSRADPVFSPEDWRGSASDASSIAAARAFALDVDNHRTAAAVSAVGPNGEGKLHLEVMKHERNTHWVLPYLLRLFERNPRAPRRVYVAPGGQAAAMEQLLADADIEVVIIKRAEYSAGCAEFHDGILDRTLVHRLTGQLDLDVAVSGATWSRGDARTWNRDRSTTDISPLVASTVALWGWRLESAREDDADYDVESSVA